MLHEAFDLAFQVTRQEVIFQQDSVFQRLMPSLDFTLRLRMIGCTLAVCPSSYKMGHESVLSIGGSGSSA